MSIITVMSDIATIVTAIAASSWTIWAWRDSCKKRRSLEEYLRSEKELGVDKGRRTIIHLMSKLSLTEDEIIRESFRSKNIICPIIVDRKTNRASNIYFEYQKS